MNVRRGLFRAWVIVSLVWAACVGLLTYNLVPANIAAGKYQNVLRLRPDVKGKDWNQPLYDLIRSPSEEKLSVEFFPITWENRQHLDKQVETKKMFIAAFPDNSSLYLDVALTQADKDYIAREFWNQRWSRWTAEASPWIAGGLVPPIILFLLGAAGVWVARGFRVERA